MFNIDLINSRHIGHLHQTYVSVEKHGGSILDQSLLKDTELDPGPGSGPEDSGLWWILVIRKTKCLVFKQTVETIRK